MVVGVGGLQRLLADKNNSALGRTRTRHGVGLMSMRRVMGPALSLVLVARRGIIGAGGRVVARQVGLARGEVGLA